MSHHLTRPPLTDDELRSAVAGMWETEATRDPNITEAQMFDRLRPWVVSILEMQREYVDDVLAEIEAGC